MFICNSRNIYSLDHITEIYISGTRLVSTFRQGKTFPLAEYDTSGEAEMALAMIADDIRTGKILIKMPDKTNVKIHLQTTNSQYEHKHHIAGKKVKGHGGS